MRQWLVLLAAVSCLYPPVALQGQAGASESMARARAALGQNRPDLAIPEYRAALAADPGNIEARGNLGVLLYFQHDCPAATPHLLAALAAQPEAGQLRALLALCQASTGQTAAAEAELRKALPTVANPRVRSLVLTQITQLAYTRGDLGQASTDVAELIKADPNNPETLYLAYRVNTDLAEAARNTLVTVASDSARTHELTAQRFINNGNATMAIRQYREALAREPDLPGLHFELGEALLQESANEQSRASARTELELALKQDPRNAGAEAKLGVLESIAGHSAAAEARFQSALRLNPDELDALVGLGEIARRNGDSEAAADYLRHASQVNAMDDSLHFRLAQIYRQVGKQAEAEHELTLQRQIRALKSKFDLADQERSAR